MLSYTASSTARPAAVWELMAQPARWHEWAPHIRGAWGLGPHEVIAGHRGVVRLAPALLIPARIVAKRPGRSWQWQVGPVKITHRLSPQQSGCVVAIDIEARGPIEVALAATYGPLIALLVRNLARVAAGSNEPS